MLARWIPGLAVAGLLGWTTVAAGQVHIATRLGGPGDDKIAGTVIAADGFVLVAGTFPALKLEQFHPEEVAGDANGTALVLRLAPKGEHLDSAFRLDGRITHIDLAGNGNVLVAGTFGAVALNKQAIKPLWTFKADAKNARIAPGPDGGAVLLTDKQVTLLDAQGKAGKSWMVPGGHVNDVACDPAGKRVFVIGFDNKKGTPPKQKNYPVQVAFVYAYDFDGNKVWTAYAWKGQEVADHELMADTRGYRIVFGPDGKLYIAGESAGGNTIWLRQSQDLKEPLRQGKRDKYQSSYNTAANHITFVGRLDPKTGKTEAGTLLLARADNDKGNTMRPRALAADSEGRIYVGGASAASPPVSRGAFGGNFEGGGNFFCVLGPDMQRLYATKLGSGADTDDAVTGIAIGKDRIVVVGSHKENLTPVKELQTPAGGGLDGWVVIFERVAQAGTMSPIPSK
jgi:hypothetical protein